MLDLSWIFSVFPAYFAKKGGGPIKKIEFEKEKQLLTVSRFAAKNSTNRFGISGQKFY